jgi:hypothetical protein
MAKYHLVPVTSKYLILDILSYSGYFYDSHAYLNSFCRQLRGLLIANADLVYESLRLYPFQITWDLPERDIRLKWRQVRQLGESLQRDGWNIKIINLHDAP